MNYRPFGSTGLQVSEVGFGAWQLGNPLWGAEKSDARALIDEALELGCTFFDTAPGYSSGASEAALGEGLCKVRDRVVLCTKFGHTAEGESDFSAAAVRPSLEASLRRLRTDHVDIYLLHNPPRDLLEGRDPAVFEELERLREAGHLRTYGVSLDSRQELELMLRNTRCGAAEVLYNVFHQEPAGAFDAATVRGVGLIAKVPLDSGWLSGKYGRGSRFEGIRDRWSPEVIARRADLVDKLRALLPEGLDMLEAALGFILASESISTVIPGAKASPQLRRNLAVSGHALPGEVVRALRTLWERELRENPLPW